MKALLTLATILFSISLSLAQSGCTDETATNYDPEATEDNGTCVYCADGEVALVIEMGDSGGDGWNGVIYTIIDATFSVAYTGSLEGAMSGDGLSSGTDVICLPEGCYALTILGPPGEIGEASYNIYEFGGMTVANGSGAFGPMLFHGSNTANCGIFDCTDPACINYNPFATEDDGSCVCVICEGDLNGDGTVNIGDILDLLGEYGSDDCEWPCIADIDLDGYVGTGDILALIASIGITCTLD